MTPIKAKINGHKLTFRSRQELARYLMDLLMDSVASLPARTENLSRIMELTEFDAKAKFLGKITTEEFYIKAYWETILSLEYMGTLPGFSVTCSIEKGNSNFSPEHRRISTDWDIK